MSLLNIIARTNAEGSVEFAKALISDENGPLLSVQQIADIYISMNAIPQATSFLLDALKGDRPEQAALQTKLLEINLTSAPQVADAILGNGLFTHYDKSKIAQLCENAGLYQRVSEQRDWHDNDNDKTA